MVSVHTGPPRPLLLRWLVVAALTAVVARSQTVIGTSSGPEALYPTIINLAPGSDVSVNATCGAQKSEPYCELSSIVYMTGEDCQICDRFSSDISRRHPITNIIDGTDAWWQGPTLEQGMENQWITIEIDLRQEFEVAYVILKTAVSPAPGSWVLERSLTGQQYQPWQYFASSDAACRDHFGLEPTPGKPKYRTASEVICTSYFSKLNPLMKAQIYVPLITGRPTSERPSPELLEFVRARYIRIRLQAVMALNSHLLAFSSGRPEPQVLRSYFYSLSEVTVGGRCVCNGHATECPVSPETGDQQCECAHNTCGATCDKCCPLYNQRPWSPGGGFPGTCEKCQCYGHAEKCYFDEDVDKSKKSVNMEGHYEGGGVCVDCQHFTTGTNCESCLPGYYRPSGVSRDDPRPCRRCQCDAEGATGDCVPDNGLLKTGQVPGSCVCWEGFAGEKCDRCARGYRDYPRCEACPCDEAGTVDAECEGDSCLCKAHVRGPRCDSCKPGFFNLQANNPDGCTECFCFGLTSICSSTFLGVENVTTTIPWSVVSLDGSVEAEPYMDGSTQLVANDEMADIGGYYWRAPRELLGLKVYSYGQPLLFHTSWVVRRGDTAGRPIRGPDVILEGDGLRIGYGYNMHDGREANINALLTEENWYRMSTKVNRIARRRREKYDRGPISRRQLMRVLGNMTRLLVRAKYHSDQIEGGLHDFVLKIASESSVSSERTTSVEQCECPPGYAGLSCELCDFGYRRLNGTLYRGECVPCDCHGHAADCDPFTGQCSACLHNTVGDNCELCAPGYYGDARRGTPDACRPCACPGEVPSGDASAACRSEPGGEDYVCTSCPPGHEGKHCDRCGPGHYGSPLTPGGSCLPCDCSGMADLSDPAACDPASGECLLCQGHTAGWHCEVCQDGFYTDADTGECRPCECGMFGSTSPICGHETGQCSCKELFVGNKCDRCQNPGGNIEADCLECYCDLAGSLGPLCDPSSGQCRCRAGVTGVNCTQCLPDHFGFGREEGCLGCQCNKVGSTDNTCDIITGACSCRPGVVGRQCDQCQEGYFGLESGAGCRPCDCDPDGSQPSGCDPVTGRCRCKPGVGGERCTSCLPGYFQLAAGGCQECQSCSQPGHLCDPVTGQCVCPPNTVGAACERCTLGHWGWNNVQGCTKCACDRLGSQSSECDTTTGQCRCFEGFGGLTCDRCEPGFFDFPRCQTCRCDPDGSECDAQGNCPCDQTGQCPCKKNTSGEKCDRCVDGTFGMSADNPDGCTACFCFTRSGQCSQGEFVWVPTVIETKRIVILAYNESGDSFYTLPVVPWNTQEICYIHLTLPDNRAVTLADGQTRLNVTNSLRVLPGFSGDVTVGLKYPSDAPIYWELPPEFLGDKVRSYNGHLRFRSRSFGGSRPFPASILSSYPLVQLQGNIRLVLEHYPTTTQPDGYYQVKLHENFWRVKGDRRALVTREMLMVALQNTQHVLIRATDFIDATRAELSDVSWDIAEPTYGRAGSAALGIERCACPRGYNGSSCQDPSIGFYRSFTPGFTNSEVIIDLVGESVPCECNGRSEICHPDTGHCQNCTDNTSGDHCEVCARGYYGNPAEGACLPCLCPTARLSNAETCLSNYQGGFRCQCDPGYTGGRCDKCAFGYYGSALEPGIGCTGCACDPNGSIGNTCDAATGQCQCREGVIGRDCTRCADRHVVTERGCQACRDGCVEHLFEEIDNLSGVVAAVNLTGAGGAPWSRFYTISNMSEAVQEELQQYQESQLSLRAMYETIDLSKFATTILIQVEDQLKSLPPDMDGVRRFRNEIEEIYQSVKTTEFEVKETVTQLRNYAIGETSAAGVEGALAAAEAMLAQMRAVQLEPAVTAAQMELLSASDLLSRLRTLLSGSPGRLSATSERLRRLMERVTDMTYLLEDGVRQPLLELDILLKTLQDRLAALKESHREVKHLGDMCDDSLDNSSALLTSTQLLYDNAKNDIIDLRDQQIELQLSKARLRQRTDTLSDLTDDYHVRHVLPAQVHAGSLMTQAKRLEDLFKATRQEATSSLQAAEAYQNIVNALTSARQAAEDASAAAEHAYEQAYPKYTDSLVSLGNQAKTRSEALSEQADELRSQVVVLSGKMAAERGRLGTINETLRTTRRQNEELRTRLAMNNVDELAASARAATADAGAVLNSVSSINRRSERVEQDIQTVLRPGLERLQFGGRGGMGNFTGILSSAQRNIVEAGIRTQGVEEQLEELQEQGDTVGLKLQQLRNKILKARQAATNIRVSLTERGANAGRCSRVYRAPQLQPSTASSLRLNYAISDPKTRDALLLYLPSQTRDDFMALEMVNRRIRFLWNNGGQTQKIEYPRRLKTNNEQLMKDQHWYIIDAERIGSLGHLSVRPASGGSLGRFPEMVSNSTSDGFSIMDLTASDRVYVGLPSNMTDVDTTAKRFAGCLYEATVNGQPLGLWNFVYNEGCGACRAGPSSDGALAGTSWYSFSGAGYAELPPLNPTGRLQNMLYTVVLSIKTFDEDALLFLVVNEKKDQFFSVELRDGQIVARVGFNKSDVLLVTSNGRYNTGTRTTIEATKSGGDVGLKINNGEEFKAGAFHPESSGRRGPQYQLSLDSSPIYFGGVPPDFDRGHWPEVTFVPLLGCVEDMLVGQTAQNPLVGNSTGVARGCGRQLMKTAGFHGEGYVELNSRRLRKTATFGFTFKTAAANGLLMLSTFASKEEDKQQPETEPSQDRTQRRRRVPEQSPLNNEYYMLSLRQGKLELRVNGGGGEAVLISKRSFNDGRPHTVTVLKRRRDLQLRVSDIVVATGQLPRRSGVVQAPQRGGLFLGGVPPELSSGLNLTPPPAFDGCISDVIFGDSLMEFDAPLRHKRVTLGRCNGDLFRSRMLHEMASQPEPTSCNKPSQVTLEARAVKLGDNPFSHVFVPIQRKKMRRNFNITLDFRTFYPNGLLLHTESPNRKRSSSLTLRLQNGAVHLTVRRKRRTVKLSAGTRLNDGQWQTMTLVKTRRKYTLLVSGASPVSRRGPNSLRTGRAVYVGGLPAQGTEQRGRDRNSLIPGQKQLEMLKTERFKGCIKQLGINGRLQDLPSRSNIIHKVGQCMARVELGTFFAGDAFAKYADGVKLGDKFDLRLDFRTSKLNGMLVILLNKNGKPTLSLELRDGDMVFTVDNGAGQPIEARQTFPAKFIACNNQWHTVRATYGRDQAVLKVDQYPERYGVSSVRLARPPPGALPLYLGGLPDSARSPQTPLTDNFKGCIRNIDINGARRDWTDMAELSSVLLNSCPVQR